MRLLARVGLGGPAVRAGRQPAARQPAHPGDRPRPGRRPGAAGAGRARGRAAAAGEAGAGANCCGTLRGRAPDDPARGARHGVRHGPGRPHRRDGFRLQALRGRARRTSAAIPACRKPISAASPDGDALHRGASACPTARSRPCAASRSASRRGRSSTVIGPNGAGKTTLLPATMGLLPSTRHARPSAASRLRRHGRGGSRGERALPGAGAARTVRGDVGGRQPAPRLLQPPRPQQRAARVRGGVRPLPPAEGAPPPVGGTRSPAASGRCWRSAAR